MDSHHANYVPHYPNCFGFGSYWIVLESPSTSNWIKSGVNVCPHYPCYKYGWISCSLSFLCLEYSVRATAAGYLTLHRSSGLRFLNEALFYQKRFRPSSQWIVFIGICIFFLHIQALGIFDKFGIFWWPVSNSGRDCRKVGRKGWSAKNSQILDNSHIIRGLGLHPVMDYLDFTPILKNFGPDLNWVAWLRNLLEPQNIT